MAGAGQRPPRPLPVRFLWLLGALLLAGAAQAAPRPATATAKRAAPTAAGAGARAGKAAPAAVGSARVKPPAAKAAAVAEKPRPLKRIAQPAPKLRPDAAWVGREVETWAELLAANGVANFSLETTNLRGSDIWAQLPCCHAPTWSRLTQPELKVRPRMRIACTLVGSAVSASAAPCFPSGVGL